MRLFHAPLLMASLLIFGQSLSAIASSADTIFYGGPIVTVNANNEEVQALAVQGGKIVALGTAADIKKNWQGTNTQMIDLKGQTLMPGLVEPHIHIVGTAVGEVIGLNLSNFTLPYDTLDTLVAKMKARLKDIPAGGWLVGFGVDPSRTSPFMAELNADVLDKVSTTVPIFIVNQSGHIGYVNHKAIELSGITESTPSPGGGGIYMKDAKGKLSGVLIEPPTFAAFMSKIPQPSQNDLVGAMIKTTKNIASKGVTTSAEITLGFSIGFDVENKLYQGLTASNSLPIRVRAYLYGPSLPASFNAIKPGEGNDRLRYVGVKFISDGSTQGLTAALNEPYIYPKGTKNRGELDYKDADLLKQMKVFYDQGWQIATHANGDRAIEQTLNNYSQLLAGNSNPASRRLRIEHFTVTTPDQVKKAAQLGVIPGFTIGHVNYWGKLLTINYWGLKDQVA